jgi:hypothetical protein
MQQVSHDTLNSWHEEGYSLILQNAKVFHGLVAQAQKCVRKHQYDMAAIYCSMAASYASGRTCGLFVSLELERVLLEVGQKTIHGGIHHRRSTSQNNPQKILHVATHMKSIGGHSRMLWRWIQQDSQRSHSLVLTRQSPDKVPQLLEDAVNRSKGEIYILNESFNSFISWAKRLREISTSADLVVLHTHNYDVIPILAFSSREGTPPIVFLDHADHLFWLGASIADVVASLRESGSCLAQKRRHIKANRNVMLPVILEPIHRVLSRSEAKQQLGICDDQVLLLSIARSLKYRTINGMTFADAHVSILQQFENAILVVIGPGEQQDWVPAIQQTQGRIRVLAETEHTSLFYQAADIYVDSFPFVSNTSLLEAGSYGVPLVTRYPYSSEACGILGADMFGLTGNLIRVQTLEEYIEVLSHLIMDADYRRIVGEATQHKIAKVHQTQGWQGFLEQVYYQACSMPKGTFLTDAKDEIHLGEPDVFLPRVHDIEMNTDQLVEWHLPLMPSLERFSYWFKLVRKYGLRAIPINLLLPEWLRSRYYFWRHSTKNLGIRENILKCFQK